MTAKVFEAALGIGVPWSVGAVEFDETTKVLTVPVDFKPGTRFKVSSHEGLYPVHDTWSRPTDT
jgi:transposase